MIDPKRPRILLLALALAFVGATSCGSKGDEAKKDDASESDDDEPKKESKKAKKADVDPELAKKADALAKQVKNGRFPGEVTKDKENAPAILHLAKAGEDTDTVCAALAAMETMYTSSDKSKDRILIDAAYNGIVLARLGETEAKIQAFALKAASHSILGEKADTKIIDKMIELAESHPKPEGRYAAIDKLWAAHQLSKNAKGVEAIAKALDAKEPWLVSSGLFRLRSVYSGYADKAGLEKKLVALLSHADPGVRGRAADLLSSTAGFEKAKQQEIAQKLLPLLGDSNAFVKSSAMSGLAWLKHAPAIHEIVKQVDDLTSNTYEIKGFTNLDGTSGWVHHDGSAWSRTGDAALYALKTLSSTTKEKFDYKIDYKNVEPDLKKAASDAKAWYAKVKADVPTQ